ncbi:hypothetical protein ZYGM_003119 [Zygosaccharomyces mellis]|uniref:Gfd2/YDR514C-like C-terminal domain-containing protein n=1 Tax=Zygosaccharomyces mellis TaxID=42258 RepID=A0A4C2E7B4_9SACH|nr:hypothetical protein ZYGM_003119 [Zygosaccharomyces mellis]
MKRSLSRAMISSGSVAKKTSLQVRSLPDTVNVSHGTYSYKNAIRAVVSKNRTKRANWVDEFEEFARLRSVNYENDERLAKAIEDYLRQIGNDYRKMNAVSTRALNEKLQQAKLQWVEENGPLPGTESSSSSGDLQNVDIKQNHKLFQKVATRIKDEHYPLVHAVPGNSNFEYLCNCVRLVSNRRTILFSLDIEAFERDNNVVTEIGISIYDPRENLHSLVPVKRNYHLVIFESLHLRNKKFVCDSKDCYILGESLVLDLQGCVEFVQALVDYYMIPQTKADRSWSRAFVGHNLHGDLKWLRMLGVNIPDDHQMDFNLTNLKENKQTYVLDTEKLYRSCYGNFGGNLGRILRLFRIPHAFLHNAGNDAHYTLQLLMCMCDVSFRKHANMDELEAIQRRIKWWLGREKIEPKVLPISYVLSVNESLAVPSNNNNNNNNNNNVPSRKRSKGIVQTEFGGARWFDSARSAFESTLC